MRPVSNSWAETISGSHELSVAATVIEPDGTETPLTPEDSDGTFTDGTVTLDGKADVRGACTLTLRTNHELIPVDYEDLLAPYVNEIRIERGHTGELVTLGYFRIYDSNVTDNGSDLEISITGYDRSKRFVDATVEEAKNIPSGTNFATAISDLLLMVDPTLNYDFIETPATTPLISLSEDDSVWTAAQTLANAIGMLLYFDGDGVCRLLRSGTRSPVWTVGEGGALLNVSRAWSRQGAINRVVATGENPTTNAIYRSDPPAIDDNPLSPTYYKGPFGKVTFAYSSSYITSQQQADDAAASILAQKLGTMQQVNFGSIVNPALEPNDVVTVVRSRLGLQADLVIDQLTIPLDAGSSMTGVCRATQVTL